MRKLILRISVSIDGFMESADCDLGFSKTRSPEGAAWLGEKMEQVGVHLLGRKSFCDMAKMWPSATSSLAKHMNETPKIVFSKKGFDPASATDAKGWSSAKVVTGDLATGIMALKKESGKDLMAHGGLEFVQNLVQTGLVDEFCLAAHPVAAGHGHSLFAKLIQPLHLKLIETKVFSTGAMGFVYRPQ